jgi:hypothetical protein
MIRAEKNLLPNEAIQYKGKLHPVVFARGILFALLGLKLMNVRGMKVVAFLLLGIAALSLIMNYIRFVTYEFLITNERVVMKFGWLRPVSIDLFHDRIESVIVSKRFLGKIGNYGEIEVRGIGRTAETFSYLANPEAFRRQIQVLHAR